MNFLQFPWRLASLAQILSLFLLANLLAPNHQFTNFRKILIGGIITLLALTLVINYPLRLRKYYHFSRDYWLTYPESSSTSNENLPTTFTYNWQSHLAIRQPQISSANSNFDLNTININVQKWTGSEHLYTLGFPANTNPQVFTIIEDTAYYPGWETKINGQKINYVDDTSIGGRLAFDLTPNTANVTVKTHFTGYTLLRRSSEIISLLTLIGCMAVIVKHGLLKR